jgi:hypothetical protein
MNSDHGGRQQRPHPRARRRHAVGRHRAQPNGGRNRTTVPRDGHRRGRTGRVPSDHWRRPAFPPPLRIPGEHRLRRPTNPHPTLHAGAVRRRRRAARRTQRNPQATPDTRARRPASRGHCSSPLGDAFDERHRHGQQMSADDLARAALTRSTRSSTSPRDEVSATRRKAAHPSLGPPRRRLMFATCTDRPRCAVCRAGAKAATCDGGCRHEREPPGGSGWPPFRSCRPPRRCRRHPVDRRRTPGATRSGLGIRDCIPAPVPGVRGLCVEPRSTSLGSSAGGD